MAIRNASAAVVSAALLLSGCSFTSDALWPALTGESGRPSQAPTAAVADAPPPLGSTTFVSPGVTPGVSTGTSVGQKVGGMRGELGQLQARVAQHNGRLQALRSSATSNSQRYHGTVAAITTRLQLGTTPSNPILLNQWNQAQIDLDRLASDINGLNSLANEVASASSTAAYLLDTSKATYALPGAIDEDHRQLQILEDETNRTVVSIDRLLTELQEDITRQTNYIGGERGNLSFLASGIKNGELAGPSLRSRAINTALASTGGAAVESSGPRLASGQGTALAIIKFDNPSVQYQQALYSAVSRALERRPNANFEIMAVAGGLGDVTQTARNQTDARRNAERVMRSLAEMGIPPQRLTLSAGNSNQAPGNEVHVFVR